jgi:hypothetical protein
VTLARNSGRLDEPHRNNFGEPRKLVSDSYEQENTFTLSLSFKGMGAFRCPTGRFSGGSGGFDILNRPSKVNNHSEGRGTVPPHKTLNIYSIHSFHRLSL